jgi:hypothetical protein
MNKEAMKLALEALEDFEDAIRYDNEQDDIGARVCCDVLSYNPHTKDCKAVKAITALREALAAQPAQQGPVAWQYRDARDDGTWGAWIGCDKRLAEDEYRQVRALYASPQPAPVQQDPVALQMDVIVVNLVREGVNKHRARELAEHFIKHTSPPAQQEPVAWMELLREARDNCKASIVEAGISASRKEYRIDLEARLTAALEHTSPQPAQRKPLTDEEMWSLWNSQGDDAMEQMAAIAFARAIEAAHGIKENT